MNLPPIKVSPERQQGDHLKEKYKSGDQPCNPSVPIPQTLSTDAAVHHHSTTAPYSCCNDWSGVVEDRFADDLKKHVPLVFLVADNTAQ